MAYTTVEKVLRRAKLVESDVHTTSETAQEIVEECIADADAEINARTRHTTDWVDTDDYYGAIQVISTDLAASYLYQREDIGVRITGSKSKEIMVDRATQLYKRAMKLLSVIPGVKTLISAESETETRTEMFEDAAFEDET